MTCCAAKELTGRTRVTLMVLIVLALGMTACGDKTPSEKAKATGEAVGDAIEATDELLTQSKDTDVKAAQETLDASEAQAVMEFETRLKDYLALHRKLEATLPGVPKQATPEQVDKNQQALSALIRTARAGAKQGELFTPDMQALVRRALAAALAGPDGENSKATIMDEDTDVANLKVNDRYPDAIPFATTPLQVLKTLPKLDEGLEYRFVGKRLVLMDTHANMIVDFTENVLP